MKILIIEIWGLGDAILATGAIKNLQKEGHEISVICKHQTHELLKSKLEGVRKWHTFDFPWTSHTGKYKFWSWKWVPMLKLLSQVRQEKYDMSLSIRADPRDDLLSLLGGVKKRIGYKRWNWWPILNDGFSGFPNGHRVESWERLTAYVTQSVTDNTPALSNEGEFKQSIVFHVGASVAVRRWPLDRIEELIEKVKSHYDQYETVLICDPDGFGTSLEGKVDCFHDKVSLQEMIKILGSAAMVIGNDSGPTHIAAALKVKTCTIFGPQFSKSFRPWSSMSVIVEGRDCKYKACKDYCKYDVPHCIEDVPVAEVWTKVKAALG